MWSAVAFPAERRRISLCEKDEKKENVVDNKLIFEKRGGGRKTRDEETVECCCRIKPSFFFPVEGLG